MSYRILYLQIPLFLFLIFNNKLFNNNILNCEEGVFKPLYFNDLNKLLNDKISLTNAFSGIYPVIIKNNTNNCLSLIDKYIENDGVYVEMFNSYEKSKFYKYFKHHITLHLMGNYTKYFSNGNILHKDQLLPFSIRKKFPTISNYLEKKQFHIVCSCRRKRKVTLIDSSCLNNFIDLNTTKDFGYPNPLFISNSQNSNYIIKNTKQYKFNLEEGECLLFNPFQQIHLFESDYKDAVAQVSFFNGIFTKNLASIFMKLKPLNKYLYEDQNRFLYEMDNEQIKDELL